MALIMVSYDLHSKKAEDYQDLTDAVEQHGDSCVLRVLHSTWLIHTSDSPSDVKNHLRSCFKTNDSFLVNKFTKPKAGWLPEKDWAWINERI